MTETRFLLSEHNNRYAPMRSNGVRWWGYPGRNKPITCIVLHTAETPATSSSARSVAEWQSRATVPSSYHVLVDSTTTMRTVNDRDTAFHVARFNSGALGLSFATKASDWNVNRRWDSQALERAAVTARQWQALYSIPARWLTRPEASRGVKGFVRHSTMDPGRRGDPGMKFPAGRFFDLLDTATDDDGDDMDGVASWARDAWARVVKAGLLDGTRPSDPVTRQELAAILDRLDGPFLADQKVELAKLDPATDGSALRWLIADLRARR